MPYQPLYESIFSHAGDAGNEQARLQKIIGEHPYFSLAHFFLLKQTPEGTSAPENILAKTALHFNNPFLLNQQLKKTLAPEKQPEVVHEEESVEIKNDIIETTDEEIVAEENVETETPVAEEQFSISETTTSTIEEIVAEEKNEEPEVENPEEDIAEPEEKINTGETPLTIPAPTPVSDKNELLFEPLHTTDYFASQGIRLSDEIMPTDKLGKQLKSFTEWLKSMKKVHNAKLPEGNDQLDASVNKLAEKSNRDEEVITEAMAEAYITQGKPGKAKDVYLKLSLQNPSKNAYFAAKIDEIAW